jgi:hypothetical protein
MPEDTGTADQPAPAGGSSSSDDPNAKSRPSGEGAQTHSPGVSNDVFNARPQEPTAVVEVSNNDVLNARPQEPAKPSRFAGFSPNQIIGHNFGLSLIWLLGLSGGILLIGWNVLAFKQEIDRSAAYDRITTLVVESPQTTGIEQAIQSIEAAQRKPPSGGEPVLPQPARNHIAALLDDQSANPDSPAWLAAAVTRCRPALQADKSDAARSGLDDCLMLLNTLRLQSAHADISPERSRFATELLKQLTQAQQEQRTNWLQLAQMILLNLLLPLLTAVFGYAFGREQAKDAANRET